MNKQKGKVCTGNKHFQNIGLGEVQTGASIILKLLKELLKKVNEE